MNRAPLTLKLRPLLLTLAALSALTGAKAQALTGGSYSTNPRYSAIIKVRMDFGSGHNRENCSGTFISPRHILTSAHCLIQSEHGEHLQPIKIDFSTFPKMDLFWDPNTVESPHVKFTAYPAYLKNPKSTSENDIGVIEFDKPMSKTWLRLADTNAHSGQDILVAGYGKDKKRDIWSTDFQMAESRIVGADSLLKLKSRDAEYAEGDSGGPVMIETEDGLRIVGIASYINLFKGAFGGSKDRAVRVDPGSANHAWVLEQIR